MKEPYGKGPATQPDPESCAGPGKMAGEALAGANAVKRVIQNQPGVALLHRHRTRPRKAELLGITNRRVRSFPFTTPTQEPSMAKHSKPRLTDPAIPVPSPKVHAPIAAPIPSTAERTKPGDGAPAITVATSYAGPTVVESRMVTLLTNKNDGETSRRGRSGGP